MIRTNAAYVALDIASALANRGVQVNAVSDSPLSELIDACYHPTLDGTVGELGSLMNASQGNAFAEALVNASMKKDASGVVRHDVVMDELVDVLVNSINGMHNVARNQVNPIIRAVVEEINGRVGQARAAAGQVLTVVPDYWDDCWNSGVIDGMVKKYTDLPIRPIGLQYALPPVTGEHLQEIIATGSSRFDGEVQALVAKLEPSALVDLYNALFVPSADVPRLGLTLQDYLVPSVHRDKILLIHLMAKGLQTKIPEGTALDLDVYRSFMIDVVEQTGRALNRVLDKRIEANKRKDLVISWPAGDIAYLRNGEGVIVVDGLLYNAWLNEGGCPEIIFGSYITDRIGNGNILLEQAEELKKSWARQERLLQSAARSRQYEESLRAIRDAIYKQIDEMPAEERVAEVAVIKGLVDQQVSMITEKDLSNIYLIVRRCVCRSIFPHTQAEMVLQAIDNIVDANPGIEIREAALLATVEIVGNWLTALLTVDVIPN